MFLTCKNKKQIFPTASQKHLKRIISTVSVVLVVAVV